MGRIAGVDTPETPGWSAPQLSSTKLSLAERKVHDGVTVVWLSPVKYDGIPEDHPRRKMDKADALGGRPTPNWQIVLAYAGTMCVGFIAVQWMMTVAPFDRIAPRVAQGVTGALFVSGASLLLYILMRFHSNQTSRFLQSRLQALQLLETIADTSIDPMYAKDLNGRYILFNRAAGNAVGKSPEEVLGHDVRSVFPEEQAQSSISRDHKVIADGRMHTTETTVRTPSGLRTYLETKGPLRSADGAVIGVFGVARDITERIAAEHAIRSLNANLSATLQAIPDLLFELDGEGTYIDIWARDPGLLARQKDALLGNHVIDVLPHDAARVVMSALHEAERTGSSYGKVIQLPLADRTRWFEISVARKETDDQSRGRFVVLSRDITERKRDAAELEQYRHHLEELVRERTSELEHAHLQLLDTQFALENVGIAIHWVDPATGRFVHVNKCAAEMLGYTVAEMLELSVPDIDPHFDAVRFRESIEMLRQQSGRQFESSNRTKDGRLIAVEVTLYYLSGETTNRPPRVVAFLSNITQRIEAGRALLNAKEAAEAASVAKSVFLANMTHEIRTPLSVIIGLGQLLQRDANRRTRRRLDQLCATSDHLLALINDILDLSKIEAEQLTLDGSEFQLGGVVEKVVRLVADRAHEKGLRLTVDVAPALRELRLIGDPLRLAQVLINLCSNAVKFTDHGRVRLALHTLGENADGVTLGFTVQDTGCGIRPDDQVVLFQPFSQVDASMTRKHGGTGLGLSICQRLVALMGGTIKVDSQVNTGSTFSFDITLPRAAPAPSRAPVPAPAYFFGKHVLFADDHPQSQEILLEMLEDLGCDADVAADGAEAVEFAQTRDYDLILMDMQMPTMDGLAATRAIRTLPAYRDTPIIALTANAFGEDRQRCLDAGMNGHLAKPVTPAMLAEALGRWLPDLNVPDDETSFCDNELSRALMQIQGLEVPPAWRRSPEHVVGYCTQLVHFIESNAHEILRLRQHLMAGDEEAACNLAHDLKGIAGLVGACRVASLASDIEHELRSAVDTSVALPLANECGAELTKLAEAIRTLPVSVPAKAGT